MSGSGWKRIVGTAALVACALVAASGTGASGSVSSGSGAPWLSIRPGCFVLGHSATLKVTLRGVPPGARYSFVEAPSTGGFGGGEMGSRRAGHRGVVFFKYPAPTGSHDKATWTVTASRKGDAQDEAATFIVTNAGGCRHGGRVEPANAGGPGGYVIRTLVVPAPTPQEMASAGNMVIWTHAPAACKGCGEHVDLMLGNVKTRAETVLARWPDPTAVTALGLSTDWVVWLEHAYPQRGWKLTAENLRTHRRVLIDHSSIQGGPGFFGYPTISLRGDLLAYSRSSCLKRPCSGSSFSIRLANLATSRRKTIASSSNPCTLLRTLSVSPSNVVWSQSPSVAKGCPRAADAVVVVRERETGANVIRPIRVPSGFMVRGLTASDAGLAWVETPVGPVNGSVGDSVWWMPLTSGKAMEIQRENGSDPRMEQGRVSWFHANADGLRTLLAMDLIAPQSSASVFRLGRETPAGRKQLILGQQGTTAGSRVLWSDEIFAGESGKDILSRIELATMP